MNEGGTEMAAVLLFFVLVFVLPALARVFFLRVLLLLRLCLPPLALSALICPAPSAVSNASPAAPRPPRMSRQSPVLARAFADCSERVSCRAEFIVNGMNSTLKDVALRVVPDMFALMRHRLGAGLSCSKSVLSHIVHHCYICVNF